MFSPLQFSSKLNKDGIVKDNITTTFPANVAHIYGGYSFDQMALGVQWSAIWLLDGTKPVHIQTNIWKLASGGYGDTDWDCTTGECVPGDYVVQIFVGSSFKIMGDLRSPNRYHRNRDPDANSQFTETHCDAYTDVGSIGALA